jgi:TonB family protein
MKHCLALVFAVSACLSLSAQSDANSGLPQDPKAILEMAAPFYNSDSLQGEPFHLSYRYRLLDEQGKATTEGKVEYWWAPGNVTRVSWTKGENVTSEWRTNDSRFLRAVKGDDISSMEHRLSSAVLFSLPKAQVYDSGQNSLKLVTINNAGSVNLCVAIVPANAAANVHPDSLAGVGTAYCFDSQAPVLVSTLQNHTITNSFSHVQNFHGHNIAGHIDISYVGEKRVEADLEEATQVKADDAAFTPSPDAKPPAMQMITVKKLPVTATPNGGVKPGMIIEKVPPVYPASARAARISGTVVIQATIGKDGRVTDATVVSSPDDSLSQAALDAVRQWRYLPYTLNGEPVAVKTTINVSFGL